MRLTARLVDLLQPAARDGLAWLAAGALPLGHGEGIAWTERARGLLVHQVQLAGDDRVTSAEVRAPTEWNLHPEGVLAQALATLPDDDRAVQAARLAAAFDPGVEFAVETGEPAHA